MNLEEQYGIENVEKLLNEFRDFQDKSIFKFKQVVKTYGEHAKFCQENKVNTGFTELDKLIKGIQPGEVCYIVSPTDVGKTAIATNITQSNLDNRTIIPFFSLENNEYQMFERIIQLETGSQFWETQKRFIEKDDTFIKECEHITKKWDCVVNIVKRISLNDIIPYIKVCEKLTQKKVKFVVFDYVQLVKHLISNEYTKISDIAQTIKEVSLLLKLPIIVLSQTSRINTKSDKGLDLYSAKGSGEIENSAQIYFTLENLDKLPLDYEGDIQLMQLLDGNDDNWKAMILTPHKLKRSKKSKIVLLMNKRTLKIVEYDRNANYFKKEPKIETQIFQEAEETPF